MAYRIKFLSRALREMGKASEWYELQYPGLSADFVEAIEERLTLLEQNPLVYAEVVPRVRRTLLTRFPYGIFYIVKGTLIHVLAIIHEARNPKLWPTNRQS